MFSCCMDAAAVVAATRRPTGAPAVAARAVAAADRIGKVEVDHGETSCKTPEAVGYIEKIWVRKEQRAANKKV